jgi:uncharacterized iron-regulated protein
MMLDAGLVTLLKAISPDLASIDAFQDKKDSDAWNLSSDSALKQRSPYQVSTVFRHYS